MKINIFKTIKWPLKTKSTILLNVALTHYQQLETYFQNQLNAQRQQLETLRNEMDHLQQRYNQIATLNLAGKYSSCSQEYRLTCLVTR